MNMASSSLTKLKLGNAWVVFLVIAAAAAAANAQTFTTLASFDFSTTGSGPNPVIQGIDGNIYGVAYSGQSDEGTIFEATTSGSLTTLYKFCPGLSGCSDGATPSGPLVSDAAGILYGSTHWGGNYSNCSLGCGVIFQIAPGGVLKVLHSFDGSDGAVPSGIVLAAGNLYGTTAQGGANNSGTVFRLSRAGQFTTLYSFCQQASCPGGYDPQEGLTLGWDGALYGVAEGGKNKCGSGNPCGTVYRISLSGKFTTLLDFPAGGLQGWSPTPGSLLQTADGTLYGSTEEGGTSGVFGGGTIFKISSGGEFTTIYNLCSLANCADGSFGANFVLATDGNFYGTTQYGGDLSCNDRFGCGTIFKMTPTGALTTLHTFQGPDGGIPEGLVQATDGSFYGVTQIGGTSSIGTFFRLSAGLGPFVKLLPTSGRVGQTGDIVGQGLTGTTAVFLNEVPASFTVMSDTLIRATVPAGGKTGFVTVVTPTGTLTSNVAFQVAP